MRIIRIRFVALSVLFLIVTMLLGCMPQQPAENSGEPSEKERQKMREAAGDDFMKDVDSLKGKYKADHPLIAECLDNYLFAQYSLKSGSPQAGSNAVPDFKKCAEGCASQLNGPEPALAKKYEATCREQFQKLGSSAGLDLARESMKTLRESPDPYAWMGNVDATEEILRQSAERVGADNPDLKALWDEYKQLIEAHQGDIDKAKKFLERPDIVELTATGRDLDDQINLLKKNYAENPSSALARIIQVREDKHKAASINFGRSSDQPIT